MKPAQIRRVAQDIDRRLEPDASPLVSAETEGLYRSMPYQALVTLKVAFTLDRDQSTNETTRAFCQSRIDLIERVRKV